jgi:hypothetical protein
VNGNVYTNEFNGGPYQQWKLQPSDVDGYSYIVDVATGRYLDVTPSVTPADGYERRHPNASRRPWRAHD